MKYTYVKKSVRSENRVFLLIRHSRLYSSIVRAEHRNVTVQRQHLHGADLKKGTMDHTGGIAWLLCPSCPDSTSAILGEPRCFPDVSRELVEVVMVQLSGNSVYAFTRTPSRSRARSTTTLYTHFFRHEKYACKRRIYAANVFTSHI